MKRIFFFILLAAVLAAANGTLYGQRYPVRIAITVTPPYPVSVSYYADHPEQVIIQIMNTGRLEQRFRLVGSINGLDNNVKVTARNRGASEIITLNPGESRSLSVPEIQDLFDARNLSFSGINVRQAQIDDGLPEGLYNVCAFAVDAIETTRPVSEQTCSNSFRVTNLEPPMIISPMPDVTVRQMPVQNTVFTWTMPASAPPTTEYTLRMIEVVPGMNINQAILSATTPVFFERTVQGNTLLYGPADPPLVPGRRYAFVVAAKDRMMRAVFRNNGRSAVQSFIYAADGQPVAPTARTTPDLSKQPDTHVLLKGLSNLTTTVKGRLVYAFPEDYSMPAFKDIASTKNVPWKEPDQKVYLDASNFQNASKKRAGGGIFEYEYHTRGLKPAGTMLPVKKTRVSLVEVYAYQSPDKTPVSPHVITYDAGDGWQILSDFYDSGSGMRYLFNGKPIDQPLAKVLDSRITNDNGEYSFSFTMKDTCGLNSFQTQTKDEIVDNGTFYNNSTGEYEKQYKNIGGEKSLAVTLHKICILVVESPYFCSPFVRIYARPGDNIQMPEQVSLAKTFQSRIYTVNDVSANQAGGGEFAALQNIGVEVFRMKPGDPSMPTSEGQNLPATAIKTLQMGDYANAYPLQQVERVVAIDKTNATGAVTINRVLRGAPGNLMAHAYTAKSVGVYNKADAVENISLTGKNLEYLPDNDMSPYLVFNAGYPYERLVTSLMMFSKKPRVAGRVVEQTKGLAGVQVYLYKGYTWKAVPTDNDGYFQFDNLEPGDYWMMFEKKGYNKKIFGAPDVKTKELSFKDIKVFALQMGQLLQTNDIQLIPSSTLIGFLKDEAGNPVVADIQLADGAFYKTSDTGGAFEIPAQTGTGLPLKVYPRSDEYMDEVYKLSVEEQTGKAVNNAGVLVVHRNRHRIKFNVVQKINTTNYALPGATVTVKGIKQTTDAQGQAYIEFESPGEKFLVSVKPPKNSNVTHWEEEITIPVSKTAMEYTVMLQPGVTILAMVTEEVNGKSMPSKNARVYIKRLNNAWDDNPANYTEGYTDDKGVCQLKGIPPADVATTVEVFVSKQPDANGSFTTASQNAVIIKGQPTAMVQFKLQYIKGFAVNIVWGMPVQIEALKALGNDRYQASGSFVDLPGNDNFTVSNADTRLDFKDVVFAKNPDPVTGSSPRADNNANETGRVDLFGRGDDRATHIPEKEFITTQQNDIRIRIFKKLQGHASAYSANPYQSARFTVHRTASKKAVVNATVQLDLASFKGAYQLSGDINLGIDKNTSVVDVLRSDTYPKRKFAVGQRASGNTLKNLSFSVHGFKAEADIQRSYTHSDSVNLFTVLHTNIQGMTPADLSIQAGYLTILPEQILPFDGGDVLSFSLEKWKAVAWKGDGSPQQQTMFLNGKKTTVNTNVQLPAWYYDKNNGGIIIPKLVINTGVIGVGLNNVVIKPNRLIADKMELDNADATALTLGGVAPLSILPSSQISFGYDPNCYHDNKPHWRLSLLNPNGKAAELKNLDGLDDGQTLPFESMTIFSDNQQQLSGTSFKSLVFKKVLNFTPVTLDVGTDNFTLVGDASFNIPNLSNGGKKISAQIMYTKGNGGKGQFNFKPLYFNIEGSGKVTFQASDLPSTQTLTSGLFTADGAITVYDDESKQSFPLKGKLVHQKVKNGFDTYLEIAEGGKIPMGKKHMIVKGGIANSGMHVQNGNWDNLILKTVIPTAQQGGFEMVKDEEKYRSLTLVVKGAIETDPKSGMVGLKGMDTGMGNMSLLYNFERGELYGQFAFDPVVPVNVGVFNITGGHVAMAIGENGLYTLNKATGQLALPGGIPLPIDFMVGVLSGYYTLPLPDDDQKILLEHAVYKKLPDFMATGIKGIYSSASAYVKPLDEEYDLTGDAIPDDIANVSAYAYADLSFEVRNYVHYKTSGSFDLFSALYGYGEAAIGGEATIFRCGPKAKATFDIQLALLQSASSPAGLSFGAIKNTLGSMTLEGCGSVGASLHLEACLIYCASITLEKHISLHFKASPPAGKSLTDALKIWCTLDDCGLSPAVSRSKNK